MKTDKLNTILIIGGLIAAIFVFEKLKSGIATITAPIQSGVANLYLWFTQGPAIQASGQVVFQDGSTVPISSIASGINFNSQYNVGVFTYNGMQYAIPQGSGDANGNYPAVPFASVVQAGTG